MGVPSLDEVCRRIELVIAMSRSMSVIDRSLPILRCLATRPSDARGSSIWWRGDGGVHSADGRPLPSERVRVTLVECNDGTARALETLWRAPATRRKGTP